jgi:hypothetical protein
LPLRRTRAQQAKGKERPKASLGARWPGILGGMHGNASWAGVDRHILSMVFVF